MRNFIDKFEKFVDKIGKPNFVLIVFILLFIAITGLYQTFSLFTSSEGMGFVDGVKTYQFILNSDISENTLTIPANSSKKFHVTIDNEEDIPLKYGVYYSSSDLSSISLGYLSYSTYKANGVIEAKGSYEISFGIDNNSDSNVSIKIGVSYGLETGGDLVLDTNNHWFSLYNSFLNEIPSGSYVKYVGNNGCSGKSCEGQNANYVSDTDMGYCANSSYKYNANGWQVAYVKDGTAYLTSAGSPECMCTSSDGTAGTSCSSHETTGGTPKHIANLNAKALTYCNSTYAYEGKCDSNSAWNMADADFQAITGDTLSAAYNRSEGYYDSYLLINNGGYYWFATSPSSSSAFTAYWNSNYRRVHNDSYSDGAVGLRPVLRLSSTVKVTGGSGTYEDPYTIINYPFSLSEVEAGSYVEYTGNNGCSGKSCEGQNANYVSDTDMGYCYNSSYKYNANGWRVAYIKDGTAYITSAGSPECMCTNEDGTAGTSCSNYETTGGTPKHIANLNAKALTYCNSTYAYGEKCDSSSAWNMADADFQAITGATLSAANTKSGYESYSLINNGGYYWFSTPYNISSFAFRWDPISRYVSSYDSRRAYGVRPVLRLQSSVVVTGGTGTYEDPYKIEVKETKLSEVEVGSYVKYTGNNGCSGKSCEGQNANYVSDTDMGYCDDSSYKYNVNGWRVAYIKDETAYLTSSGSPECMCTSSDGTAGTSCSSYETTDGTPKHIANLNAQALTYCNSTYAYGEKCDSNSAWNMADADFQAITGGTLSIAYLRSKYDSYSIVNNGGYYWFATPHGSSSTSTFFWYPNYRYVTDGYSSKYAYGVRPVLRLASSVVVTGGSGTYEDPYTITKKINKLSEAGSGSYVKYTGNNGCTGKACEGQNANYVSDTDMGYCYTSSYEFNVNGWRVAYVKDGTAYLTSAGSPECMCTNSDGTAGTSCSSGESTSGLPKHLANLNAKALTYCNSTYAYGGKCDSASAWNMADADFQTITGATLSTAYIKSGYESYSLINNGGYYWFATPYISTSTDAFIWGPSNRYVNLSYSGYVSGLRPVLRLQSSVVVTGGSGTYEDPYMISNG